MTSVRLLVGTAKGGFVLRSDGGRSWEPVVAGEEVFHVVGAIAGR